MAGNNSNLSAATCAKNDEYMIDFAGYPKVPYARILIRRR